MFLFLYQADQVDATKYLYLSFQEKQIRDLMGPITVTLDYFIRWGHVLGCSWEDAFGCCVSFLSNVPCQDNSCPECSTLVSLVLQDPPSQMEPLCTAIAPGAGWLAAPASWGLWARCGSVLQAQEMLCAQQRVGPVLSTWDLLGSELYCRLCSWKSYASVKLESMGQSPSRINYRKFYVRKCKEPHRVRRKVHLITILSLATAKWRSLARSARTERVCSNPSPEFSPKIQEFQTVAVSLYSRVLHRFFFFLLCICPFLNMHTFLHLFLCEDFCSLTMYCVTENLVCFEFVTC